MLFGGKIKLKDAERISYMQYAYHDAYSYAHAIEYDGELTPEVCAAIMKAWNGNARNKPQSSWGMLRWSGGCYAVKVDVENRTLIVEGTTSLCD